VPDVVLPVAVLAGALALLSPCSALLLPSFFAYAFRSPASVLLQTAIFLIGLLITLVPLGMGAAAASALFYGHRELLIAVAGWTVIGLGALQLVGGGPSLPLAGRLRSSRMARAGDAWWSSLVLGAVYGLAGFCSGPVLGAILTVAATRESPLSGGLLLAAYSLGMVLPLLVLALVWDRLGVGSRRWLRGRTLRLGRWRVHTTQLVSGLLLVGVGALFLRYDGTAGLLGSLGLGDTVDLEYAAQEWLLGLADAVPGWLLPVVAGAVVVGALAVAARRRAGDAGQVGRSGDEVRASGER
jgi:cytochrome c biogenesis protein CcdA